MAVSRGGGSALGPGWKPRGAEIMYRKWGEWELFCHVDTGGAICIHHPRYLTGMRDVGVHVSPVGSAPIKPAVSQPTEEAAWRFILEAEEQYVGE